MFKSLSSDVQFWHNIVSMDCFAMLDKHCITDQHNGVLFLNDPLCLNKSIESMIQ